MIVTGFNANRKPFFALPRKFFVVDPLSQGQLPKPVSTGTTQFGSATAARGSGANRAGYFGLTTAFFRAESLIQVKKRPVKKAPMYRSRPCFCVAGNTLSGGIPAAALLRL
jgi:hypothetical protein